MTTIHIIKMRLEDYQKAILQNFADLLPKRLDCTVNRVEFGKQDIRGSISISIVDDRDCIPMQRGFSSKDEMLGYISGWIAAFDQNTKWI